MHNPSGSFRPFSASRFFWSCAAHGRNGRFRVSGLVVIIHTPEKSGLPSEARGAGAVRFGFPSAPLGMPWGYSGHWADSEEDNAARVANSAVMNRFISVLPHSRERPAATTYLAQVSCGR